MGSQNLLLLIIGVVAYDVADHCIIRLRLVCMDDCVPYSDDGVGIPEYVDYFSLVYCLANTTIG